MVAAGSFLSDTRCSSVSSKLDAVVQTSVPLRPQRLLGARSVPGAASNAPDLGEQNRTQDLPSSAKLSERHRQVHVQLWGRQAQGGLLCRNLRQSQWAPCGEEWGEA